MSLSSETARLERLIHSASGGHREALGELYERTHAAVYGYALSVLKRQHDAEDVAQEVYLRVMSAPYRPDGHPMAWLFTVARNIALDRLRAAGREAELPDEELVGGKDFDRDDRLVLEAVLGELADDERQIVTLHAVAGFKHREIAKILELPLSTVLSRYARALKKLRKKLEEV